MKIRRKDGTVEEVENGTALGEGETEVKDEEEKAFEAMKKELDQKVKDIIQALKDTPERKIQIDNGKTLERSVMETDLVRRKTRPFVQLSKSMEEFATNFKVLAKGGVVKALNENTDSEGGFLVPEEFNAEVIQYATEGAIVRGRARVLNMTRDAQSFPKLLQTSEDQFAGADVYWEGESQLKTESQPSFGKVKLTAKKLIGLVPVTDELLADSAVNLVNFLVAFFGQIIAYKEDYAFLRGNGMFKPLGIVDGAGKIVNRETANKIGINDVQAMWAILPAWATSGATWLTTKAGYTQLLKMRADAVAAGDQAGALLFAPSLAGGLPVNLLDLPILLTDKLPAVGTKGDIILCNLAYYFIGDRGALEVASSIHDRFRYDETTLRFVKRVDGEPSLADAFVVLDVPEES